MLRGPHGTLVILAIVGVIALVGVTTAFAAGGGEEDGGDNESSALKGSITAPRENGSDDEAAQAQELQKLAKIDRSAAEKAALRAVPGTVKSTKLDDENGYVIYEVEVAGNEGQTHQAKVDAGNGKVLQQEVGEENESGERDEQ